MQKVDQTEKTKNVADVFKLFEIISAILHNYAPTCIVVAVCFI